MYSWVTSVVSQSSYWLSTERSSGAVTKSRTVLNGMAVALPLASSVSSLRTTSTGDEGAHPKGAWRRSAARSATSPTRRATGSMSW